MKLASVVRASHLLFIVIVAQARSQLQPIVELEIGFTEEPVAVDRQIVGIAAEDRSAKVAGGGGRPVASDVNANPRSR